MVVRNRKVALQEQSDSCQSDAATESCSTETLGSNAGTTYVQRYPPIVVEAPDWPHGLDASKEADVKRLRILHWGPIIALFIIGFISAVTTHYSMMWWPFVTPGGFIHFSFFVLWNYLTLSNMFSASFIGAGYIPLQWSPPKGSQKSQLQYCKPCDGYKAPRSHHCSKCGRCVMKMDHHCPWINNCVGHRNHGYFVRFLFFAIVGCVHAIVIHIICAYHIVHQGLTPEMREVYIRGIEYYTDLGFPEWLAAHQMTHPSVIVWYMRFGNGTEPMIGITFWTLVALIGACAFSLGVTVGLSGLLYFQLKGIWKNRSGIEDYIDQKAHSLREPDDSDSESWPWFYPYDLGWRRNCKEVLFHSWDGRTKGNGVWWPVTEPCHQFTLTEEQLAQKEHKRRMARLVQIDENFAGGIFGSCRFGCKIFFCQPISEDARVKVSAGERWVITQATKYWFYGHKFEQPDDAPKGWFPRRVATLLDDRPYS